MRLESRVQKLEADRSAGRVTVIVWQNETETQDEALERWKQEHPGQELAELKVFIVRWAYPDDPLRGDSVGLEMAALNGAAPQLRR